jgi:hypothetical protein
VKRDPVELRHLDGVAVAGMSGPSRRRFTES